jgi:hypothetical protein
VIINNDAYRLATSGLGKLVVPTRPSEQTRCRKRLELPKLWPKADRRLLASRCDRSDSNLRTLATGVSPYNGVAKHRASLLQRVFKQLGISDFF